SPSDTKPTTAQTPPEPEPEPEPAPGELVNLALPKDGGAWPWSVGAAAEPRESRPVSFKGVGPYTANGFAVRPEVNRAVVSMRVDPFANNTSKKAVDPKKATDSTRVTLYDIAAGTE